VESVSVQFALLAVARTTGDAPAELGAASESAAAAGHQIVAEEIIANSEGAVRAQLQRFIADPQVDVVIVLAGAESDVASRALKPLISEVLPGFTDLFRWMMFQEAGASAMLSSAEAAQCDSTIVFVLPGAVGPAMEKLILPQFDPATTPRNLVDKLPRLRTEPGEGVPQPITQEKTQGGSGVGMRLPAVPSGRMRSRTGANVVHREQPTNDPTKPIDLSQLEGQLAASGVKNDDVTRLNPAAPNREVTNRDTEATAYAPGADEDHTDVTLAAPPPPKLPQHPGMLPSLVKSTAAARNTPLPSVPKPGARTYVETTAIPMPVVRLPAVMPPVAATPAAPVTINPRNRPPSGDPPSKPPAPSQFNEARTVIAPNPIAAAKAADTALIAQHEERTVIGVNPIEAAKAADAAVVREDKRASKPKFEEARTTVAASTQKPFANVPKPAEKPKPVSKAIKGDTTPGTPAPTAFDEARTTHAKRDSSLDFDEARTVRAPGKAASPAALDEARTTKAPSKPPASPKPAPPKPAFNETPTVVAPPATNGKSNGVTAPARDDLDQAAQTFDGASGVMSLSSVDAIESIDPDDLEEATPVPAARPVRPPTEPPPSPVAAKRAPTAPPPVAKRSPTAPPATQPAAPSEAPPARKLITSDLPRGSFAYPVQKPKSSLVLKLLMFAAIIGVGFGAVVLIFREKDKTTTAKPTTPPPADPPPTPPPPPTNPVVAIAPDAAEALPPPPLPPDAAPVVEPTPDVGSAKPPTTKPPTTKPPTTKPPTTKPPTTKPPTTKPPETTPIPEVTPPPPDDDCDETSCILSKYDRPCCSKYKPVTSPDLAPRVGDTPESLDKSMVRAGIERLKPRVVKCGEKSGAKGTVKITMTVSPDGAVTNASVADTPEAALGDCVLAAMRSAKFGKTVNGATFTYPFAF
jgi:molybdenum cofactor biosynthesis protein B